MRSSPSWIVLRHSPENLSVEAICLDEARRANSQLEVDISKNEWVVGKERAHLGKALEAYSYPVSYGQIIGIYDRNNMAHLNQMVNDTSVATKRIPGPDWGTCM